MYNLTGIYWVKNEGKYIPEYVEFHLLQGFDHFILYDNGSTDNELIKPYTDAGIVELRTYPPGVRQQQNFWLAQHCCTEQAGKSRWIHFHSIDERLFCPDGRLVTDFLKEYEQYGGVCVAWEEFNSNGHKTMPKGLIIENYTQTCVDKMCHIKTITQPGRAVAFNGNPHNFTYRDSYYSVTENGTRVNGAFASFDYSFSKIKNHHYRTLSEEEFNIKMNKGVLDHPDQQDRRREQAEDEWAWTHGNPSRWGQTTLGYNDELLKYVPIVREALQQRYKGNEHLLGAITC
jgi:hypothetical protein